MTIDVSWPLQGLGPAGDSREIVALVVSEGWPSESDSERPVKKTCS